jgi:murein DD-endopeptidase MepM/ murein hydrolase activator NlpD
MMSGRKAIRFLTLGAALGALGGCATLDWDLRPEGAGAFSTADEARAASAVRPAPDANGVISYPDYQVAVAREGDTVASVATRVGIAPAELASYNALPPETVLRPGEVLALPRRVAAQPQPGMAGAGGTVGTPIQSGTIEVTTLASGAIDRAEGSGAAASAPAAQVAPPPDAPIRHRVERGETLYSIARLYNVSPKTVAEWNGLDANLTVREGQYLIIPAPSGNSAPTAVLTQPGQGSPTPPPPSAAKPLPDEKVAPAAKPAPGTPPSPELEQDRTAASAARFAMPVEGSIIRAFAGKRFPGIDIAAPAGSPVKAAGDGTVAAITKDTNQVPVLVIRHADNILTVYTNIDGIKVAKGDKVSRGQTIAAVRAGNPAFLHFEVRNGIEAVDPMPFLQ